MTGVEGGSWNSDFRYRLRSKLICSSVSGATDVFIDEGGGVLVISESGVLKFGANCPLSLVFRTP